MYYMHKPISVMGILYYFYGAHYKMGVAYTYYDGARSELEWMRDDLGIKYPSHENVGPKIKSFSRSTISLGVKNFRIDGLF